VSAESFTVLAILEARDRASEIFARADESLGRFSETARSAAGTARGAGAAIDEALGRTVPASERLEIAGARLAAAQEKAAGAARALAGAERELLGAQREATGSGDAAAAASARLVEADRKLAAVQKEAATAAKGLRDAQAGQVSALRASAAAGDANAAAQARVKESSAASGIGLASMGKTAGVAALGLGVAGAVMVKAAGNFQDSTTHLVTDAGESAKNLAMVQAGILRVSTATGTSAADITNAMYHIESGGYHGAAGLRMLEVSAQGARVGGADLDTVSKTLVGTMNAYGMSAARSASFMNQLIATVGAGDMRMQDLASSLSSVAPLAAAAHIQFSQVGGAIATMTAQGMSAQQATQNLANTIRNMSSPNNVAIHEMQAMGLSSQDISQKLGQRGLTGTIGILTQAITSHMGRSGQVIQSAFAAAKVAAQDANVEIAAMPPNLQALAKGFLAGSVSTKAWHKDMQGLSPIQAHLMTQFAGTAVKTHAFNSLLTSGSPAAQTYTAALAKMMGGATGLNTALMLSGSRAAVFAANTAAIADAAKKGGDQVSNWSTIQGTFNYKLDAAKTGVANTGIAIGSALLPAATSLLSVTAKIVEPIAMWTAGHRTLTAVLFGGVTALAATVAIISVAAKAFKAVTGAVDTVRATLKALGLISRETAVTQAASAQSAAGAETAAAAESASAQGGAAAESSASWISSAASSARAWAASAASGAASAARQAAQSAAKAAVTAASNAAGAMASAAAWAASAASALASGAMAAAGSIARVAVMVAANVAGAAVTMGAWIAANAAMSLGIGLIVIAVVAAVALIVTHWRQVSAFARKAFDEVLRIVGDVIGWVKGHWPLLLAILTGPFGLAALWIVTHWRQVTRAVSEAIDWVKGHWPLLLAILAGPIGLAVLYVVKHFGQIRDGAAHLIGDLASFFGGLPGRILSALGDLGSLLFGAGGKIIQGLINGVMSMIGGVGNAIGSVVSTIKSFLPFSPAKQGPLSGAGDPASSGKSIARNLAAGMASGSGGVSAAARGLAAAASARAQMVAEAKRAASAMDAVMDAQKRHQEHVWHVLHMEHLRHLRDMGELPAGTGSGYGGGMPALGGGGPGGGGAVVNVNITGNTIMSERDIDILIGRLGPPLTRALAQAGIKIRMG
jgi:TP901 family phage tail tape measure protein